MPIKLNDANIKSISALGKQFSDTTILMHQAIAKKVGLSGTDHKYLNLIIQNGAVTAGELSKITGLTTGAITGLIDRLEKKKFVKREFDKNDRRKIIIVPNYGNSMKLLKNVFSDLQGRIINHFSTLGVKDIKIIEKYLVSTIEIMNDLTNDLQRR